MQGMEPRELNDDDLVARIMDGSEEEFNIFYNRYFDKVYSFAYQWLRCHERTEAVVQGIFDRVLLSLGSFERGSSLSSWIFGIVKNGVINSIRHGAPRQLATPDRHSLPSQEPCPVESLMRHVRVLLAEDHPEMRERVAAMIAGEFMVVGKVCDGEALVSTARLLDPDLIVADISMPNLSGTEAADRLGALGSRAKLVFLTVHEDLDCIKTAFSVGARGYVVKSRLASDLLPAMRRVISGGYYLSPGPMDGVEAWIKARANP